MKPQIQHLSSQIQESKENSIQNKELELKKDIQDYLKNFWWINKEINNISISSREEIEDLFEEYILEDTNKTKEIEEEIFNKLNNIQETISSTIKEKTQSLIWEIIEEYLSEKEILNYFNYLEIWDKISYLEKINWENFLYKIENNSEDNQNNKIKYKKISKLNKQEKIFLIKKYFSKINPKSELKYLQEKRNSHEEWEEKSYLHLDKNNWVVRNYYQINSNLRYLERKLNNNEYINFPSLNKIYNKLQTNYNTKKPVYLVWETWWWKTELAKKFLQDKIDESHPENKYKSQTDKITPIIINSNEDTSSAELESTKELVTETFEDKVGNTKYLVITKEMFQWLKKWSEEWIPVILDEVNKMPQWTLWILNEYLSQVQDSWIYNWHSKVKKWFFIIMTWNEWENYLARNELDPSIKRRVDTIEYPYLDKKDLAYLVVSQLNNFNKYQYKEQNKEKNKEQNTEKLKNKNTVTAENNFNKSLKWLINWFNLIQKEFAKNRIKEAWEEKDFIYTIPSPDIWTIKNIVKKYNYLNNILNNELNNKLNTTLEIQIFEDYIKKDIYNLDSQIYLFNIFKKQWLFKNFNEIIPQELDNLLNKSSEEKYELVKKIEDFIEEEKQKIKNNPKTKKFTKTELALQFHDELKNQENDDLFEENKEDKEKQEKQEELDLTLIDDIQEELEKNNIKKAIEKEKQIIKEWEEKYPEWAEENLDKIIIHEDWIEFNIELLEWKIFQRENLKVKKPDEKNIFSIPEDEHLKDLTPEDQEKIKDEQLFTWDAAMEESKKQWLRIPSDEQWGSLVEFMPWKNEDEKYVNLRSILNLQFSCSHYLHGCSSYWGSYGSYWSSTSNSRFSARYQRFNSSSEFTSSGTKYIGLSVRCIKD